MAFNSTIDFWTKDTAADGAAMSAPLQKLLENDNFLKTMVFDSVCETQAELLAAITSETIHTILWKGNTTLIDFVATAGTFKLIYCQHYSLLGKNSTLVAPAGKSITIYGDIDCAAPDAGGFSWTLNCTSTSSIKCKWIRNSGVTGKVICDAGTVLYERKDSALTLQVNGTLGSESYITQEFWDNTNNSKITNDTIENNTWYLDTINGDDNNSGLSRYSPKKTGDAIVIACKTAGKTTGQLIVLGTGGSVSFNAINWADVQFPFFDVILECSYMECVWNGVTSFGILKVQGGLHTFNGHTAQGEQFFNPKALVFNGGKFSGLNVFDAGESITINGLVTVGQTQIKTPSLNINSAWMIAYEAKVVVNDFAGSGNISSYGSYGDPLVLFDLQTVAYALKGYFSFPNQSGNTSIKITASKMNRSATTKLLYLGAQTGVTVNYQLVVDSMGEIVPIEIGNPAGTISGKVIELLKYENKVDAEIIRATAAEALKEDKSKKNAASGYCPLDENVKIPFANIPDSILGQLEYQGVWDASTGNFPTATESGQYWIASSNGTGTTEAYKTGDWAVYNGTAFDKVDNSDAVFSVNGRLGNVVVDKTDVGLGNVDNVSDVNKPVSTAQAAAIAAHADLTAGMHGLPALDHFVYGDTIYGGSIVDNLNTLARTMPFTCFGTATGAPSADYSWFGWHINSNAGVAAAVQILWAFNSSSVICYERVKTSNMWGTWELQGTTGTVRVDSTNSPFAASGSATTILASTNTGDVVITMPTFNKKQFNVKWDEGVHNLTIVVANGGMIDGQSSYVVNDLWAVKTNISLLCKESGIWFIV